MHWVGNLKQVYTMMHGQKNIRSYTISLHFTIWHIKRLCQCTIRYPGDCRAVHDIRHCVDSCQHLAAHLWMLRDKSASSCLWLSLTRSCNHVRLMALRHPICGLHSVPKAHGVHVETHMFISSCTVTCGNFA